MISISRLRDGLVGDWVAFDEEGEPVDVEIPVSIGPAAILVNPVTDAVKRVEGDVVESLDRERMWLVEAIVLNRVVLHRLSDGEMAVGELLDVVRGLGYSWQVSPISSP